MEPSSQWTVQDAVSADYTKGMEVPVCHEARLRYLPGRRSVWQARHENREILLKAYDVHAKQARDASREWDMATKLFRAGLPMAEPLFKGEAKDGQLVVAYTFIPNGTTLNQALSETTFAALFRLVAQQHDAGFYQTDNHLGNYFWSEAAQTMTMLDAGSCQSVGRPLTPSERSKNLAILAATVPLPMQGALDTATSAYVQACTSKDLEEESFRTTLVEATDRATKERLRRYLKKTRRACTEFEHEGGWLACRDLDEDLKKQLQQSPNQFFGAAASLLKDGNTCTVVELSHKDRQYVLKRYNQKPLFYRLSHAFTTPRALRSWSHGHALRAFAVPTPRPLACLLIKDGPLLRESYLLMEKVEGISLHEHPQPETMAAEYAQRVGELKRLMGSHGDLKASNFIVTEDEILTVIDLDSFRFHDSLQAFERAQAKDRRRFLKNWRDSPAQLDAFQSGEGKA